MYSRLIQWANGVETKTKRVVRVKQQYHPIITNGVHTSPIVPWVAWCYCFTSDPPQLALLLEHETENQSWTRHNTRTRHAGGIVTPRHGDVEQNKNVERKEKAAWQAVSRSGVVNQIWSTTGKMSPNNTQSRRANVVYSSPCAQKRKKENECRDDSVRRAIV